LCSYSSLLPYAPTPQWRRKSPTSCRCRWSSPSPRSFPPAEIRLSPQMCVVLSTFATLSCASLRFLVGFFSVWGFFFFFFFFFCCCLFFFFCFLVFRPGEGARSTPWLCGPIPSFTFLPNATLRFFCCFSAFFFFWSYLMALLCPPPSSAHPIFKRLPTFFSAFFSLLLKFTGQVPICPSDGSHSPFFFAHTFGNSGCPSMLNFDIVSPDNCPLNLGILLLSAGDEPFTPVTHFSISLIAKC